MFCCRINSITKRGCPVLLLSITTIDILYYYIYIYIRPFCFCSYAHKLEMCLRQAYDLFLLSNQDPIFDDAPKLWMCLRQASVFAF